MKIQECISEFRIKRTDKVVINEFRSEAFKQKGITAILYEDQDLYYMHMTLPYDFNEKGVYAIQWGEWVKDIYAIESNAFGVEMLVSISKSWNCNLLEKNRNIQFNFDSPKINKKNSTKDQITFKLL